MSLPLSKAANQFAVALFQCYLRRHGDKYKNLLLCPYLIYHSLAMMLVGAKGSTAEQLVKLLRMPETNDLESRHKEFLLLTEQLIHGNHEFVHLASFIYLDKGTKRSEPYKTTLKEYYETKPKKIDFDNVDLMVKTVNEDVARTTENIYHDILSKQEAQKMEKSYMLLVNAVFFRGFWLANFTDVKKAPFLNIPPNTIRNESGPSQTKPSQQQVLSNVNMMSKMDYLSVLADKQLDARIIKMPFEASDLEMLILLPINNKSDCTHLCENISAPKVSELMDEFRKSKSKLTHITMPIFCIDSGKISIQSTLVTMGVGDLFDKTKANMSGVCENKQVWLHKILHRCFIICDNRGSITSSSFEKAKRRQAKLELLGAVAGSNASNNSKVEEFNANHPFMYIIIDSVTNTILLMGLYTDSTETLEVIHENQLSQEEAHQIYSEGVYRT